MQRIFLKCFYHIRKPRVQTINTKEFRQYKRQLRQARHKVHEQAYVYQNKIEDEYLEQHRLKTQQKHFERECQFRKFVIQSGYTLFQDLQKWKKTDELYKQRLQKYLNDEQLKKMNRNRIKKILEHESENYWFNTENVKDRLTNETVLPQYLGTTEYYHKLHLQALAYQSFDFSELQKISSNELVIKQKNQILIPLFREIIQIMQTIKQNPFKHLQIKYESQIEQLENQNLNLETKANKINNIRMNYENKRKTLESQYANQNKKKQIIEKKLNQILKLYQIWQKYTIVLGMSTIQILNRIKEQSDSKNIKIAKAQILKQYSQKQSQVFQGLQQQDTQDTQITFKDYVNKLNLQKGHSPSTNNNFEIDQFLPKQDDIKSIIDQILKQDSEPKSVEESSQSSYSQKYNLNFSIFAELMHNNAQISQNLRQKTQTTSTVETLKEIYKNDQKIIKLLNQIGQAKIEYPRLLRRIWQINN